MYSTDYQNYAAPSPPPSAPPLPPYSEPALGIPISSSTNHFYGQGPQLPVPGPVQPRPQQVPWSTGLCDCYKDVPNCCITCWCPCITFGQIAEIVDKGSTSCGASGALYAVIAIVTGCPFFYSCLYRSKMRQQYLLHESPFVVVAIAWFIVAASLAPCARSTVNSKIADSTCPSDGMEMWKWHQCLKEG